MANLTISPALRAILIRCTPVTTAELSLIKLPDERLDRPVYEQVKKALELLGGEWKGGKTQAFVFQRGAETKFREALQAGVIVDEQKKFQAFYTPPELAAQVAELAMLKGKRVLEPSAGDGALVKECLALGAASVDCIELNQDNYTPLHEIADANGGKDVGIHIGDFLGFLYEPKAPSPFVRSETCEEDRFERIVMNPPFTRDADIEHVEHALKWLAPGGILVAIMLDNLGRKKFQALTGRFDADGSVYSFVKVPEKTFKDTPVRTIILKVRTPKTVSVTLGGHTFTGPSNPRNDEAYEKTFGHPPASMAEHASQTITGTPPTIETNETINKEAAPVVDSDAGGRNASYMKLRIKRTALAAALGAVKSAANNRSKPVLANVLITAKEKGITLTTTNLDLTLRAKLDATVEDVGEITVPCVLLHDIVRSVKGDEVFLDLQRKTLHLACGSSKFKLPTIAGEEFPSVMRVKDPVEVVMPEHTLHGLLASTAFAHATSKERPVLTGALFSLNGQINVVGCDGHRLALDYVAGSSKARTQLIIPPDAVTDLLRLLESKAPVKEEGKETPEPVMVTINAGANGVTFTFGDYILTTKIIEGNYPDYKKIVPVTAGEGVTLGRADLLNAVERVALVGDVCLLEFKRQTLTISSDDAKSDLGECVESLLIPTSPEATIKLSVSYLREALSAVADDEIAFHVVGNGPAVIKARTWTAVIAAKKEKKEGDDKKPETKPKVAVTQSPEKK